MDKSPQLMVGIPDRGLMVTYHAFIAQRLLNWLTPILDQSTLLFGNFGSYIYTHM